MPTYEYACTACHHEWEFEQSIKDNAITECPSCHDQTARRQISRGTGFILKGSGWYSDLYSSSSNKKPEGEAKTESKPSEAKSEGASSTSESTSESKPSAPTKSDSAAAAA
jgi:putative FmdB family regulatory protein